ncbi:DciA family protein [Actinophytocola oryzae]|uniref:DciA family protein n=1 Tax=Actinophytocola oryzae TaxID=502181 RepID=UPI0010624E17
MTPNGGETTELTTQKGVDVGPAGRSNTEGDYPQLRGSDLARAALAAAKAASGGPDAPVNKRKNVARGAGAVNRRRRRWSGSGADERDPQPLGRLVGRIAMERGWSGRLTTGRLFDRWHLIVGEDVAEHARPVELKDAELTVQADSTAWATQLRLLQKQLLVKIAAGVGKDVVKRLKVLGPTAPSWRYGPRHVRGRGPRDTYG